MIKKNWGGFVSFVPLPQSVQLMDGFGTLFHLIVERENLKKWKNFYQSNSILFFLFSIMNKAEKKIRSIIYRLKRKFSPFVLFDRIFPMLMMMMMTTTSCQCHHQCSFFFRYILHILDRFIYRIHFGLTQSETKGLLLMTFQCRKKNSFSLLILYDAKNTEYQA